MVTLRLLLTLPSRLHRTKQLLQQELLRRAVVERQAKEQVVAGLQVAELGGGGGREASASVEVTPQAAEETARDKGAAVRAAARAAFLAEQRDTRRAAAALKGDAPRQQRAPPAGLQASRGTTTMQRTAPVIAAAPLQRRAPAVSAPPAVAVAPEDRPRGDVHIAAPWAGRATKPPPRVGVQDPVSVAPAAEAPDVAETADAASDVLSAGPVDAVEDNAATLYTPVDVDFVGDGVDAVVAGDDAVGLAVSGASSDGDIDSSPDDDTEPGVAHPDDDTLEHAEAWLSKESARLSQPTIDMLDGDGRRVIADDSDAPDEAGTDLIGNVDTPQEGDTEEVTFNEEAPPLPDTVDDSSATALTPPALDIPSPPRSAPAGATRPAAGAAAGARLARSTTGTSDVSPPVKPRSARAAPRSRTASGVDYTALYPSFEHIFTGFAPVPGQGRTPRADPDDVAATCRSVADALDAWLAEHANESGGAVSGVGVRYYRCPCSTHEEVSSIVAKGLAQLGDEAGEWDLIPDADDRPSHTGPGSWNLLWTWASSQRPPARIVPRMLVWQRWNHFAGIKALTRKDLLCRHLGAAKASFGAAFDIMPQTFALPGDYVAFVDAFTKAAAASAPGPRQQAAAAAPLWIMKPIGLSRGRGIFMVRDLDDVAYGEPHVVQRYLERPLTIDAHKFDLRLYVLVTSFAPTEAFIYTEGFARFSTERYSAADVSNLRVHLTNYAVQSAGTGHNLVPGPLRGLHSGAAGGSKCSLTHLWAMLAAGRGDAACDLAALSPGALWPRICDLVRRALFCARSGIGHQPNAFELLGFDVMLDRDARPWLLEVNSSPSLECDHPLDERIKTRLLADLLAIVAPPDFDRAALAAVLRRRGGGRGSDTREALNTDLGLILKGRLPRRLGEPPPQPGLFERIAPGPEWDALLRKAKQ